MEKPKKHIIIVAGETSGDIHAAHLVEAIRKKNPEITFSGVGGRRMETCGVKLYSHLADQAVVGFTEVIRHLPEIRKIFRLILDKVKETQTQTVILVDFPGFNLRLARELKKTGVQVIYYISPQVWAWKENRVKLIKKYVDHMIVLFAFEKEFYGKHGYDVSFVGHPLLDSIQIHETRDSFLSSQGLPPKRLTVGLLPGSREKEIQRLLPIMIKSAEYLSQKFPQIQFLLLRAQGINKNIFEQAVGRAPFSLKIIDGNYYEGLNASDLCLVTSGTATLETAICQKPMVIVYKTSFLTWLLARLFIRIPYIGLVNVVAGRKIVPECIQFDANPANITRELSEILTNEIKAAEMKTALNETRSRLGAPGANARAAAEILRLASP